jgi:hypothetical protein
LTGSISIRPRVGNTLKLFDISDKIQNTNSVKVLLKIGSATVLSKGKADSPTSAAVSPKDLSIGRQQGGCRQISNAKVWSKGLSAHNSVDDWFWIPAYNSIARTFPHETARKWSRKVQFKKQADLAPLFLRA